MGSPSLVPVPCPSTASTWSELRPEAASADRMTRSCAGPDGAVSPLLAPSWLNRAAAEHGQDPVPAAAGVGTAARCTIRPRPSEKTGSVGPGGVGPAAAVGRQAALPGEFHQEERSRHDRHPACQGHRAFA